jgi:hypothetical protein
MKTDRELLELAAKAAAVPGHFVEKSPLDGYPRYSCGIGKANHLVMLWNPLECDGEALRLAMSLNISVKTQAAYPGNYQGSFSVVATIGTVENSSYGVCVSYSSPECFVEEYVRTGEDLSDWQKEFDKRTPDKMVATRRAIVRAAAKIGELTR